MHLKKEGLIEKFLLDTTSPSTIRNFQKFTKILQVQNYLSRRKPSW